MSDFISINQPRVDSILSTVCMIRKSARANKISEADVTALLSRVPDLLGWPARPTEAEDKPKPRPVWRDPPHQDRIGRFVADVPRDHVEIYITRLVARLCEMAKQKEPTP